MLSPLSLLPSLLPLLTSALSLPSSSTFPYILPSPSGPYHTTLHISPLTDLSRTDPFSPHSPPPARRILTSTFTPIPPSDCAATEVVPYMNREVAIFEAGWGARYAFPGELWRGLGVEVCANEGNADLEGFPLIILSPGFDASRLFYSALAQELSSWGYTVVSVDFPYDADIVAFPPSSNEGDGEEEIIYRSPKIVTPQRLNESFESINFAGAVRVSDLSFLLDTLNYTTATADTKLRPILIGHSFGGATSFSALHSDPRFRGAVNMDGTIFDPTIREAVPADWPSQGYLWVGQSSNGRAHTVASDSTWAPVYEELVGRVQDGNVDWIGEFTINNTVHGSFDDIGLLIDTADLRPSLTTEGLTQTGSIGGERMRRVLSTYLVTWVERLWRDGDDGIFFETPAEFPEVGIVREPVVKGG